MTTAEQGGVLLLVAALATPIAALMFARSGPAWRSIGKGPLAIEPADPDGPDDEDPEVQAAEVRQMVEAKAERQRRRSEEPLDVEAEVERQLADLIGSE